LTSDRYHPVPSLIDRLKGYYASNNKGMVSVEQSQSQERENHSKKLKIISTHQNNLKFNKEKRATYYKIGKKL
jgi:hypothetical protein